MLTCLQCTDMRYNTKILPMSTDRSKMHRHTSHHTHTHTITHRDIRKCTAPHVTISLRKPGDPLQHIHISHSTHGSPTTHRIISQFTNFLYKAQTWTLIPVLTPQDTETWHNSRTRLTTNKHTFQNSYSWKHTKFSDSSQNHITTHLSFKAEDQYTNYTVDHNGSVSTSKLDIKQCPFNKTHPTIDR